MTVLQPLAIAAADLLALSMVAVLSFALGMIVTILFVMARSGSRPPDIDIEFLEEEEEGEGSHKLEARGELPAEAPRELWELDPDWWKA
jgi:hypothetical protein